MRHTNLYSLLSTIKLKRAADDFEGIVIVTKRRGLRSEYGESRTKRARIDIETGEFQQYSDYVRVVVPRLCYNNLESSNEWKLRILRKEQQEISQYETTRSLSKQWKFSKFYHAQVNYIYNLFSC